MSFLLNFSASFLAGVLLLLATALVSERARWVLTGVLGRLLDVDIDAVFTNKQSAESDVRRELARATAVSVLTGRGNEFQRNTFDPLFVGRPANKVLHVRILLPKTELSEGEYDWVSQRESELARFDRAFGRDLLREQIEANTTFLRPYVAAGQVELARFSAPHIARIIITDRCAFYTPYRQDSHGRDSPIFKYRRGELYDNFVRLFNQLWTASQAAGAGHQEEGR